MFTTQAAVSATFPTWESSGLKPQNYEQQFTSWSGNECSWRSFASEYIKSSSFLFVYGTSESAVSGVRMFAGLQTTGTSRWRTALVCSLVLHGIVLVLLHPRPVFVRVSSASRGAGDKTYGVAYLAPSTAEEFKSSRTVYVKKNHSTAPPRTIHRDKATAAEVVRVGDTADKLARAGSPYGSLYEAMAAGREVRPALPTVFPDPPIERARLAAEIQGDVIVEVTIDAFGDVIETRLLSGVGHGIDEQVVATLRSWRFKPATIDGVPIASKQDVHFHFPV
jgi:protein TonB